MKEITFQEAGARVGEALATILDRRRLFDALNALALLDENQEETTLSELALEWRRRSDRRAASAPPPIAVRDFFARYAARLRPEQTCSRGIARSLGRLAARAWGPDRPIETLRREDLLAAVAPYGNPGTYNGHLSRLVAALRWGEREGLCRLGFLDRVDYRPEPFREPAFFLPDRVERIFRAAEAHPGPAAAGVGMALTLGFFAGVRSVEIGRAVWEDLDLDAATLRIPRPKGWTSGARPRLVELERNAALWLRKWRRWTAGQRRGRPPRGPVVPRPWLFTAWKKERLGPAGDSWGNDAAHNVMRHTYATMHVAAFRNAPATALNLGHGRSTEMLEEHYRGLVARSTAERYWRIVPAEG